MIRRLTYVDGIKGMACIGVLTYHYYTSFCQQVTGINFDSSIIDLIFGRVLNVLVDGTFLVYIFALISGWLISSSQIKTIKDLSIKIGLRYLRLTFPLLGFMLIIKLMSLTFLFSTNDAVDILGITAFNGLYDNAKITWGGVLYQSLYRILFLGDSSWDAPFWMMQGLFVGSIIVYFMTWIKENIKLNVYIVGLICIILSFILSATACMVVIGALLRRIDVKELNKNRLIRLILIFLGIFSLIMIWGLHHLLFDVVDKFIGLPRIFDINPYFRMIYAIVVFMMIISIEICHKIFSIKFLVAIGKISFPIFGLHWPIFCSFSSRILCKHVNNYEVWFWLALCLTLIVVLMTSWLFHITFEKWTNCLITRKGYPAL